MWHKCHCNPANNLLILLPWERTHCRKLICIFDMKKASNFCLFMSHVVNGIGRLASAHVLFPEAKAQWWFHNKSRVILSSRSSAVWKGLTEFLSTWSKLWRDAFFLEEFFVTFNCHRLRKHSKKWQEALQILAKNSEGKSKASFA